jgi:hypothetical protein
MLTSKVLSLCTQGVTRTRAFVLLHQLGVQACKISQLFAFEPDHDCSEAGNRASLWPV